MTIEDRLRQALAAQADTVIPAPDAWAGIRARISQQHRRRFLVPALATASAAVVVVVGIAALTGGDGAHQVVTEPPATATPVPGETPEPTATTAPASVPLPETFLAVRDHGTELVMVETASGKVRRTLADLGDFPEDGTEEDKTFWPYIDGVTITPDGRTVYYSTGPEPVVGHLYRVAADGGEPEDMGDGDSPQVSPDGKLLAWRNAPIRAIAIRDLVTGETRELEPAGSFDEYPGALAWAPNSRHLAFEARTAGPSDVDNAARIRVIDAVAARSIDESRILAAESGRSLHLHGFRAFDGLLGVVEAAPEGDGGERFTVRDPDGGAVRGTLDLPFTATAGVYDRSGRHQLFVAGDGTVHRRSGGPFTAVPRLGGVRLVAW
jgi:hypothetical protein